MKTLDRLVIAFLCCGTVGYFMFYVMANMRSPEGVRLIQSIQAQVKESTYSAREEMGQRAQRVVNICSRYPSLNEYARPAQYGWNSNVYIASMDKKTLLYCPVPKAGWSSWRHIFFEVVQKESFLGEHPELTGWYTPWEMANMVTLDISGGKALAPSINHRLIFVRHPYDRLVSAFKDKVLTDNGSYVRKEKSPCEWLTDDMPQLTFIQFVTCIVDSAKASGKNLTDFSVGENLDIHWKPQTLLCNVCAIRFNLIGHFDHMEKDMEAAISILEYRAKPIKVNAATRKSRYTDWIRMLDEQLKDDLKALYKYDFEVFGFSSQLPS